MKLGIVILTRDEARDLPRCLAAIGDWAPVVVVDSGSTDDTRELAAQAGARVLEHPFQSFGDQRNWALTECGAAFEWVLFLDADEAATPAFRAAVETAIAGAAEEIAGFFCCWKTMLYDRWLRRCDGFPKWQFRLLRPGRATFTDYGHGQKEGEVRGRLGYVREPYLHYAFSKGWRAWLERHNRYSDQEAVARLADAVSWPLILHGTPSQRNKALKPLVSQLPGWPLLRFLVDYLLRLGFLEGRAGFDFCLNMAYYEYLIQLKMRELRALPKTPTR